MGGTAAPLAALPPPADLCRMRASACTSPRPSFLPPGRPLPRRLEREQGIVVRFVAGRSADAAQEAALDAEAQQHRDFWRLDLVEGYAGLPHKTLAFLRVRGSAREERGAERRRAGMQQQRRVELLLCCAVLGRACHLVACLLCCSQSPQPTSPSSL